MPKHAAVTPAMSGPALRAEAPASYGRQLRLLMRRFVHQKRGDWLTTLMEVLTPIYIMAIMTFVLKVDFVPWNISNVDAVGTTFAPLNASGSDTISSLQDAPALFGVATGDDASTTVASTVCERLGIDFDGVARFDTLADLRVASRAVGNDVVGALTMGLHIDASAADGGAFTLLHPDLEISADAVSLIQPAGLPDVTVEQMAVSMGLLRVQAVVTQAMRGDGAGAGDAEWGLDAALQLSQFPMPAQRIIRNVLKILLPLMFGTIFFVSMMTIMTAYGREAERGIKLSMQLKGLSSGPYYATWMAGQTGMCALGTLVILAVGYPVGLFENVQPGLLLIAFLLLGAAQNAFCLFVAATMGPNATSRKLYIIGMVILMFGSGFYYIVQYLMIGNDVGDAWVYLTFLFYMIPFQHVLFRASDGSLTGDGIAFSGLHNDYVAGAFVMMAVDIVLFYGLALMLDNMHNKPPKPAAAVPASASGGGSSIGGDAATPGTDVEAGAGAQGGRDVDVRDGGIHVRGLIKEFKVVEVSPNGCGQKVTMLRAVDELQLDVPPGQVFCLVGHNGAGKTTTLKMLVGDLAADGGDAWLGGMHIVQDRDQLRQSLGVCPQFDTVYDELTCLQQLSLFGGISGLDDGDAGRESRRLLHQLMLDDKADTLAKHLSGGQKRRLSLAMALVGAPRVLLLDEATTGLDPNNRRNVWRLLSELRTGVHGTPVTILMTTHDMDEAEVLGDVIGVMSKGKMQAIGPTLDLKKQYGLGYHLLCARASGGDGVQGKGASVGGADDVSVSNGGGGAAAAAAGGVIGTGDAPKADALVALVQKHVPGALLSSDIGAEVSLALPASESAAFAALFEDLEAHLADVGIVSFGLSASTLEEVFLNLAKKEQAEEEAEEKRKKQEEEDAKKKKNGTGEGDGKADGAGDSNEGGDAATAPAVDAVGTGAIKAPDHEAIRYRPSAWDQFKSLLGLVATQQRRSQIALQYLFWSPLVWVAVAGIVSVAVKPDPIVPVSMAPSGRLVGGSIAFAPTGTDGAALLGSLGGDASADSAALAAALQANANAALDDQEWGTPSWSAAVDFTGFAARDVRSGNTTVSVAYNHAMDFSARAALQQLYDGLDGVDGRASPTCSYLVMSSKLSQNSFAVGGLTGLVALNFAILSAFYCEDSLRVRTTRMKDMLLNAGLRRSVFWLGYYVAHAFTLILMFILSVGILAAFQMPGIIDNSFLAYIVLIVSFSVPAIFTGYFIGFFVDSPETAQNVVGEAYNMLLIIPWVIVTFAMDEPNATVETVLSVIPGFGIYRGFAVLEAAAKNDEPYTAADVFDWNREVLPTAVVMLVTGFMFMALVALYDYGFFHRWGRMCCGRRGTGGGGATGGGGGGGASGASVASAASVTASVDGGSSDESETGLPNMVSGRIDGVDPSELLIRISDVKKTYTGRGSAPVHAVKGVTLDVRKNEILGLLGPNGAGKSSLIHVLTHMDGQTMDSGDATVSGYSVETDLENARVYMGICPQFDALNDLFSPREHLRLLARIRGVPPESLSTVVDEYLAALELTPKADAKSETLSGGNKRRLSVAMGLIGATRGTFLDEPSTGMDPRVRRRLWDFLHAARTNRSIVLTTHSMSEADALCQNIAIMIRGGVRTVGSSQVLKSRHGEGHLVTLRVKEGTSGNAGGDVEAKAGAEERTRAAVEAVTAEVQGIDAKATLVVSGSAGAVVKYSLPTAPLSAIFAGLHAAKERVGIDEFSVSQTTLEDVFLGFAKMQ